MIEKLPKQTAEIFTILREGKFISSNGKYARLFDIIKTENNYSLLRNYFEQINLFLEEGDGYFYFSQHEEILQNRERKILQLEKYIDILDFFSCREEKLRPGISFRLSKIAEECNDNPRLKPKLQQMDPGSRPLIEKLRRIANDLENESFIEKVDEEDESYKVLDAFNYLEKLIAKISIYEDETDQVS